MDPVFSSRGDNAIKVTLPYPGTTPVSATAVAPTALVAPADLVVPVILVAPFTPVAHAVRASFAITVVAVNPGFVALWPLAAPPQITVQASRALDGP